MLNVTRNWPKHLRPLARLCICFGFYASAGSNYSNNKFVDRAQHYRYWVRYEHCCLRHGHFLSPVAKSR